MLLFVFGYCLCGETPEEILIESPDAERNEQIISSVSFDCVDCAFVSPAIIRPHQKVHAQPWSFHLQQA